MVKVVIGASMRRYLLHRPSRTMPLRARWSDFRFGVADPAGETEPVGAAVRRSQRPGEVDGHEWRAGEAAAMKA